MLLILTKFYTFFTSFPFLFLMFTLSSNLCTQPGEKWAKHGENKHFKTTEGFFLVIENWWFEKFSFMNCTKVGLFKGAV